MNPAGPTICAVFRVCGQSSATTHNNLAPVVSRTAHSRLIPREQECTHRGVTNMMSVPSFAATVAIAAATTHFREHI